MKIITNQYFIVWNHGFKYIEKILDIIRDHPDIKIQRIFRKKIDSIDKFINHIYKSYQNQNFIQTKKNYLKQVGKYIYIVFIRDINTEYIFKNDCKYSHNGTYLKWYIRLLFNPKNKDIDNNIINEELINTCIRDSKKCPNWLTHNHVIHSSDIEEETDLVKEYFKLKNLWYNLTGNQYLNKKKEIKEILISDIVCNIADTDCKTIKESIKIVDTPHYKYLLGNYKEEYDKYILSNLGKIITCDNFSGSYDKLIKNFDYGKVIENEPSLITCKYIPKIKKYLIVDGLHRSCILINNNYEKIKVYIV